jgi:hypothetical protein
MINIDYSLNYADLNKLETYDLSKVDLTHLDYYLFTGDIIFKINEMDFSVNWGWIPILGFAMQLYDISKKISSAKVSKLNFTESDDDIFFEMSNNDDVRITASYVGSNAIISVVELHRETRDFLIKVLYDLENRWSDLSDNIYYQQILKKVNSNDLIYD